MAALDERLLRPCAFSSPMPAPNISREKSPTTKPTPTLTSTTSTPTPTRPRRNKPSQQKDKSAVREPTAMWLSWSRIKPFSIVKWFSSFCTFVLSISCVPRIQQHPTTRSADPRQETSSFNTASQLLWGLFAPVKPKQSENLQPVGSHGEESSLFHCEWFSSFCFSCEQLDPVTIFYSS